VIADIGTLPGLEHPPWSSRYLQGLIDVPYLSLTPSTRSGIVHDERYGAFVEVVVPLEAHLNSLIDAQCRAEEEQASRESLRAIQRAFREAMLVLPREEYDWFDISHARRKRSVRSATGAGRRGPSAEEEGGVPEPRGGESTQRQFYDHAGPLHTVVISPAASTLTVSQAGAFARCPGIVRAGGSNRT